MQIYTNMYIYAYTYIIYITSRSTHKMVCLATSTNPIHTRTHTATHTHTSTYTKSPPHQDTHLHTIPWANHGHVDQN